MFQGMRNDDRLRGKITYLHCDLEGHLSYGAEGRIEPSLSQVLLCYHASYRLKHKDRQKK